MHIQLDAVTYVTKRKQLLSLIDALTSIYDAQTMLIYRSHIMKAKRMYKDSTTTHVMLDVMIDFLRSIYSLESCRYSIVELIEHQASLVQECHEARRNNLISDMAVERAEHCLSKSCIDLDDMKLKIHLKKHSVYV